MNINERAKILKRFQKIAKYNPDFDVEQVHIDKWNELTGELFTAAAEGNFNFKDSNGLKAIIADSITPPKLKQEFTVVQSVLAVYNALVKATPCKLGALYASIIKWLGGQGVGGTIFNNLLSLKDFKFPEYSKINPQAAAIVVKMLTEINAFFGNS